ncbi:MAG TPA: M28 family peptidase [Phnomibacter sp.]|nr:M28 family peptidase [Phnomibacter sp.]
MKISLLLFMGILGLLNVPFAQTRPALKDAQKFAATITIDDLKGHLSILAGDEMEGRETATEGQKKAAAYIENHFRTLGLRPGNGDSFQQFYPVFRDSVLSASLTINGKPLIKNQNFSVSPANYPARMGFSEIVFVNFDDSTWKDAKIPVTGKLVMFFVKGLQQTGPQQGFGGVLATRLSQVMQKGAAAALIVQDIFPVSQPDVLSNMQVEPFGSRQNINYFNIAPQVAAELLGESAEQITGNKLSTKAYPAKVAMEYDEQKIELKSSNVLALLEGTDKKDEYLVITGHYDHLGKRGETIYYGADDDGSGTVGVMEIAEAFVKAKAAGKGPRRSIVFMAVSGEEKGLWGSRYYTDNPTFPLEKTTANLNIDMIGRLDSIHIKNDTTQYVYLVGDDKLSSDLRPISDLANKYTKLHLDGKYNDPRDPQRIYFRSDHYNFARKGVPILFYFSGLHPDYHRPTDTVDRINFPEYEKRARLVFYTAWEIANRPDMLKRDIPLPASALTR